MRCTGEAGACRTSLRQLGRYDEADALRVCLQVCRRSEPVQAAGHNCFLVWTAPGARQQGLGEGGQLRASQ